LLYAPALATYFDIQPVFLVVKACLEDNLIVMRVLKGIFDQIDQDLFKTDTITDQAFWDTWIYWFKYDTGILQLCVHLEQVYDVFKLTLRVKFVIFGHEIARINQVSI